eukprot:2392719-Rhodomonas_salina.1
MSSPPAPTKLQRRKNDSAVAASLETLKTILPAIDTNEKEGDDSLSTASTPKDPSPGGLSPHEAVRVGGASNMLRLARVRLSQLRNDVAQQQQVSCRMCCPHVYDGMSRTDVAHPRAMRR